MPLSVILRDKLRRLAISQTQVDYQALKLITKNPSLPFETRMEAQKALQRFPSYARPSSVRNRCIVNGKARGVLGGFKMNYMVFRERALAGIFYSLRLRNDSRSQKERLVKVFNKIV